MYGATLILAGIGYIIAGEGYRRDASTNNILALGCTCIGISFVAMGVVNLFTL